MPRFFVDKSALSDGIFSVAGDDARHIARSLRMAEGDTLTLSDGEGTDYLCRLTKIRDEECLCELLSSAPSESEPKCDITLFMAYPKGDKLEVVIQKAVELGAGRIVPFTSSRCIKRPQADSRDKLLARHTRIAEEAAKQCGRSRLPRVESAITLSELLLRIPSFPLTLFCYEGSGTRSLKSVLEASGCPTSIAVIVGSEGGFSEEEAAAIEGAGAVGVNLGPRILRCETAPAYCLSALSFFFEL